MWVIVHLIVGLAIGVAMPLPYWALVLLAIGSHVALDLVPHWDYTKAKHQMLYGALDFAASVTTLLVSWLAFGASLSVLVIGALAAAPDFDVLYGTLRGREDRYWFPSHWQRFPHGACGPLPGITIQVSIIAASCLLMALA